MNKRSAWYIVCFGCIMTAFFFCIEGVKNQHLDFQTISTKSQRIHLFSQPQDRLIGFTGGPESGKSSVIVLLEKKGIQVIPSVCTSLYKQTEACNRLDTCCIDSLTLRHTLLEKQIELENARDKTRPAILDETALSLLFFGNKCQIDMSKDIYALAENRGYDMIFAFDSVQKKEPCKTMNCRKQCCCKALPDSHFFIKEKYKESGLVVVDVPFGGVEQRTEFILNAIKQQYRYVDIIPDVINCFARKNFAYPIKNFFGPISLIEVASDSIQNPYRFFGIHTDELHKIIALDCTQVRNFFADFKHRVVAIMQAKITNGLQIVGDSNQFTREGFRWARNFIKNRFDCAGLIETGFVGYKTAYKGDVNTLVADYVRENPGQSKRILANIVAQSSIALNQWDSSGFPSVRNFVVVYNDAGTLEQPQYNEKSEKISGFTTFGDDIIMSDYLLNAAEGDSFVCFEGGAQSFNQIVNGLVFDIPVTCVYNLRQPDNEKLFSAARFLKLINNAFANGHKPGKSEVRKIYKAYAKTLKGLWDVRNLDRQTKKLLFDTAIKKLIDDGMYEKIPHLCTFYDAKID